MEPDIRPMVRGDLPEFSDLFNQTEAHDSEFISMTPERMEKRLLGKSAEMPNGYFTARISGTMVAAGGGRFSGKDMQGQGSMMLHVAPDFRGSKVEADIFDRVLDFLRANKATSLGVRANLSNSPKVEMLERLGFRRAAYQRHHMERDPRDVPEPVVPEGYIIRNSRIPDEIERMLATLNEAFATREHVMAFTLEEISGYSYFTDAESLPGAFVVERIADGKIVGMVGSQVEHAYNLEHGRKRGGSYSLAVVPDARGKGIGKALMQASLNWIASKGMDVAYLGVNHQNPDAVHLYKSLGYKVVDIWQGFEMML